MKAQAILQCAISVMEERAKQYDKPEGERSVPAVVEAFNAIKGSTVLTPADGWLILVLLKLVRAQTANRKALFDSVEDATAYAALMGEEMLAADEPFKVGEMPKPGPIIKVPMGVEPWPKDPLATEREKTQEEANKKARQAVDALVGRPPMITDAMVQAHEAFARSEAERLRKQFEGRVTGAVLPPADAAYGTVGHGQAGERVVTNTGQVVSEREARDQAFARAVDCQARRDSSCKSGEKCPCDPEGLV